MTDQVMGKLVWQAELDAKKATKQAEAYEHRLETVKERQQELTKAEREQAKASKLLRDEILKLGRAELDGAADKKLLAQQSRVARQAMREQAEGARQLKEEQRALRLEERALTDERQRSLRVAASSSRTMISESKRLRTETRALDAATARANVAGVRGGVASERRIAGDRRATISAHGRSGRSDDHMRSVLFRQGQVGAKNEELEESITDLDAQLAGVGKYSRTNRALRSIGGGFKNSIDEAPSRLPGALVGGARLAGGAALGAVGAGASAVTAVGGVGAEYESLRTSLGTALGSQAEGGAAFEEVKKFAKETPFAVKEVVQAVTTLKVRGLEPTVDAAMEALKTYGDVAGALGQSLPDVINAVSSASVGEFEELKQKFNVIGHKAGDEIKFTFAGVTTTVKDDSKAIVEYLKTIGKENFAGGMELQAKTLGGVWSNLGDAVTNFADDVYRSGLGDALKEVLGDITGNVEGADSLATTIGETLASAVRDGYEWFKEFVGPINELPGKFESVVTIVRQFVTVIANLVSAGKGVVEWLGAANTGLLALGVAATVALGPLGALFTLGLGLGKAFHELGIYIAGADDSLSAMRLKHSIDLQTIQKEIEETEERRAEIQAGNKEADMRKTRGEKAESRFKTAYLRKLGKPEWELTDKEKGDLANKSSKIYREARNGIGDGRAATQGKYTADELVGQEETAANRAVYDRLSKVPKKKRTPSQEKELKAAALALDIKVPAAGAAAKPHLSASEQELQNTIKSGSEQAGRKAYDAALLQGRDAKTAAAAGKVAETEAKTRLEGQAAKGQLPQQIDTAFARVAGYGDVTQAPPPPVFVQNNKFDVQAPVHVEGTFTGDPARIGEIAAAHVIDVLETKLFPEVAQFLQPSFHR